MQLKAIVDFQQHTRLLAHAYIVFETIKSIATISTTKLGLMYFSRQKRYFSTSNEKRGIHESKFY